MAIGLDGNVDYGMYLGSLRAHGLRVWSLEMWALNYNVIDETIYICIYMYMYHTLYITYHVLYMVHYRVAVGLEGSNNFGSRLAGAAGPPFRFHGFSWNMTILRTLSQRRKESPHAWGLPKFRGPLLGSPV